MCQYHQFRLDWHCRLALHLNSLRRQNFDSSLHREAHPNLSTAWYMSFWTHMSWKSCRNSKYCPVKGQNIYSCWAGKNHCMSMDSLLTPFEMWCHSGLCLGHLACNPYLWIVSLQGCYISPRPLWMRCDLHFCCLWWIALPSACQTCFWCPGIRSKYRARRGGLLCWFWLGLLKSRRRRATHLHCQCAGQCRFMFGMIAHQFFHRRNLNICGNTPLDSLTNSFYLSY